MAYECPAPILGCALRITRLDSCGRSLDPLTPNSRVLLCDFAVLEATPNVVDGNEIAPRTACGAYSYYRRTQRRVTSWTLSLTINKVHLPAISTLIDASLIENPDSPGDFLGYVSADDLTRPEPNPKMIEVWSEDATLEACSDDATFPYWMNMFVLTRNWAVSEAIAINDTDPQAITITGEAFNNPNWVPSYPGATFPSWDPGGGDPDGTPSGAPPPVLPAGVTADEWTLNDQTDIRAGGPYVGRAWSTLPSCADGFECSFYPDGS